MLRLIARLRQLKKYHRHIQARPKMIYSLVSNVEISNTATSEIVVLMANGNI